jgi:septation ring formation regulator EzrA
MDMTILLAVILVAVILFSFFRHRADAKRIERLENNRRDDTGFPRPGHEKPAAVPEPFQG